MQHKRRPERQHVIVSSSRREADCNLPLLIIFSLSLAARLAASGPTEVDLRVASWWSPLRFLSLLIRVSVLHTGGQENCASWFVSGMRGAKSKGIAEYL